MSGTLVSALIPLLSPALADRYEDPLADIQSPFFASQLQPFVHLRELPPLTSGYLLLIVTKLEE
ncbi:hypothetical protein [Sphingomonas sp. PP-CE-1G-424]|uniref:hypothetical protein n=1 Tax=Sphingomonas sp. PP-CE-1G-424 TaxID=2135658 RepID=UPI0010546024|nr:hypothetical protein [Sphingomonas sp. PP-CE-1G-424]